MSVGRLLERPAPVPHAIAQVFEEAGIEFVFGMPGGRTGAIFDALYDRRDRIRAVLVREEGLAAVMAAPIRSMRRIRRALARQAFV